MLQRTEIRATGNVVESRDDLILKTVNGVRRAAKVLSFHLAVNNFSPKDTSLDEHTASFYRVSAWDRDAELLKKYLRKGKPLTVTGTLELKPYASKKYAGATLHSAEIRMRANGFEFIDSRRRELKPNLANGSSGSGTPGTEGQGSAAPSDAAKRALTRAAEAGNHPSAVPAIKSKRRGGSGAESMARA